jgi:hypothetical protein
MHACYFQIVFDEINRPERNTLALYSGGAHSWSHNLFSYSVNMLPGKQRQLSDTERSIRDITREGTNINSRITGQTQGKPS